MWPRPNVVDVLAKECEVVAGVSLGLEEEAFALPTRCPPWDVKALLGHMFRDVDRILAYREEPTAALPDTTSVSYWRSYDPVGDGPDIAARAIEVADGFASGAELAIAFDRRRGEAVRAALEMPPDRLFGAYGRTLVFNEYVRTRVLEIAVHGLDLAHALGRAPWVTPEAVVVVRTILSGLLESDPPSELGWDDVTFIETGTGRRPLTVPERTTLGERADRFPLLA
jgi:uncharacterized protein (TIGR03083 family)